MGTSLRRAPDPSSRAVADADASDRAAGEDANRQFDGGVNASIGGIMPNKEPWYAFMDGPRDDQTGDIVPWPSAWAAIAWAIFTLTVTLACGAAVWLALRAGHSVAALGFVGLLLLVIGRLIIASLISFLRTTGGLLKLLLQAITQ
jgi:hypothetical protein